MHDKPKMLTGLNQNGMWSAAPPFDTAHTDSMTTGVQAEPKPRVVMFEEHGKPNTPPVTAGQPQGRLMAQWVKECGESECWSVTDRIRVETLPDVKACPLPQGLPWQESLRNRNQEECR